LLRTGLTALDFDAPRQRSRSHRRGDFKDAVVILGIKFAGVDSWGKRNIAFEVPVSPCSFEMSG
jgi:hypothetical protein